jgi:hypothetical protein
MHRRLRWGNVARTACVVVLIIVVVGWPHLAPPEPHLPGPEAAPLGGTTPGDVRDERGRRAPEPPVVRRRVARPDPGRRARQRRKAGQAPAASGSRDPDSPERLASPGSDDRGANGGRAESHDYGAGPQDDGTGGDETARGEPQERAGREPATPPRLDPAQAEFGFERG